MAGWRPIFRALVVHHGIVPDFVVVGRSANREARCVWDPTSKTTHTSFFFPNSIWVCEKEKIGRVVSLLLTNESGLSWQRWWWWVQLCSTSRVSCLDHWRRSAWVVNHALLNCSDFVQKRVLLPDFEAYLSCAWCCPGPILRFTHAQGIISSGSMPGW